MNVGGGAASPDVGARLALMKCDAGFKRTSITCRVIFIACAWHRVHVSAEAEPRLFHSAPHPIFPSTGQHGADLQAVQGRGCHLHVLPPRRRQQLCGGQRGRLCLHVVSSWKVRAEWGFSFCFFFLPGAARKTFAGGKRDVWFCCFPACAVCFLFLFFSLVVCVF